MNLNNMFCSKIYEEVDQLMFIYIGILYVFLFGNLVLNCYIMYYLKQFKKIFFIKVFNFLSYFLLEMLYGIVIIFYICNNILIS